MIPLSIFLLPAILCGRITLAACGLEEPCASFPDFCDNMLFTVFPLVYVLYFEDLIHDSRGFMVLKNN